MKRNKVNPYRPYWSTRIFSAVIDIGISFIIYSFLVKIGVVISNLMTFYLLCIYMGLTEILFDATIGKLVVGLRLKDSLDEKNAPLFKKVLRAGLRTIAGPFMLLSWKRVTFLDFLSATRVSKIEFKQHKHALNKDIQTNCVR